MKLFAQGHRQRTVTLGFALLFALGLVSTSACRNSMNDGPNPAESDTSAAEPCSEPGYECAKHVLETKYLPENGEIRFINEHHIVGGEFKFMEVAVDYEGRVADKFALWADGERLSAREARKRFSKLHEQVWGAMTIPAAEWANKHPNQISNFGMWYNADELPPAKLREHLDGLEFEVREESPHVASFESTGEEAIRIAKIDGVTHLGKERGKRPPRNLTSTCGKNEFGQDEPVHTGARYTQSDVVFNANGAFGGNQKIGIIELTGSDCGVYEAHEAFDYASFTYFNTPVTSAGGCQECNWVCDDDQCFFDNGSVPGSQCANSHTTKVASRVSSNASGSSRAGTSKRHATNVHFFVGNKGDPSKLVNYVTLMEWFVDNDVKFVNESWSGGDDSYAPVDRARDWYSREYGITFFKSVGQGGNDECAEFFSDYDRCPHGCQSSNALCVGSTAKYDPAETTLWDASRGYSGYRDDVVQYSQWWQNYQVSGDYDRDENADDKDWDVERPDVVSEGVNACVASFEGPQEWVLNDGTSLSTPVVTGMAALYAQYCALAELPPTRLRSVMRTAALARHTLEPSSSYNNVPLPDDGDDHHAGTGIPTANYLAEMCGSDEPDGDWGPAPSWIVGDPNDPSELVKQGDQDQYQAPLTSDKGHSQYSWRLLERMTDVPEDQMIRANVSFYTCLDGGDSDAYANSKYANEFPAVDYDLALCEDPDDVENCIVYSDSFYDTNEAFEVVTDQAYEELHLMLIKPANATSCQYFEGSEPYDYHFIRWDGT